MFRTLFRAREFHPQHLLLFPVLEPLPILYVVMGVMESPGDPMEVFGLRRREISNRRINGKVLFKRIIAEKQAVWIVALQWRCLVSRVAVNCRLTRSAGAAPQYSVPR